LTLFKLTEDFVSQTGEKFEFSQKSIAFLEPRSHLGKGTRALRERLSHPRLITADQLRNEAGVRDTGLRSRGANRARVLLAEFVR
jgi:hypothetical protein